jgi:hypothetical protein
MKLRMLIVSSTLALAVAVLSPAAAQGATSSSAVAAHDVAFRGLVAGMETNDGAFPMVTIQGRGIGFATHLGPFTYQNPHVVDARTRHGCGTYTVSATNGDTLTADACGDATIVSGTPPNAILSIVETGNITGGSGCFADSTGSFTVERRLNQTTGKFIGSFQGTISSPGTSKE